MLCDILGSTMAVSIKRGFRDILGDAIDQVEECSLNEVTQALGNPEIAVIDVRDQHELMQSGTIPGAHHASRGMLEFYADPSSPMHRQIFSQATKLILYCGTSGRSALAAQTLTDMGFENVRHMAGGIKAWIEAGNPVEPFTPE